MLRSTLHVLGLFVLTALLLVPATRAQETAPEEPVPVPEVDESELQTVAEVYVEVVQLQNEYQARFQQTEDPQEAQQIRGELQQAINQAIEQKEGITIERYDAIIQAAQQDEDLRNRLLTAINNEAEQGGGAN